MKVCTEPLPFAASALSLVAVLHVAEGNTLNPSSIIKNNTIHYRTGAETAAFDIRMVSARDYLVADNQLYMANNAVNRQGIYLQGCERPIVSCNTVEGSFSNYTIYDGQSAIRHDMCAGPAIHCNDVDGTTNGFYFHGTCYGTDLRGNNIRTHKWGLHLDNVAIIEEQEHKGNLWYNNPVAGGVGAWYENAVNAALYWFKYDPSFSIPGGDPEPPSWDPLPWFQQDPGQNFECEDGIEPYCQSHERLACEGCAMKLDTLIATDSLENDPYTDESKWMLEGELFAKLDDDPSLSEDNALLEDFYNAMQATTQAQFKLITDEQLALFDLDPTVVDYLQLNRSELELLMSDMLDAMDQLADPSLSDPDRQVLITLVSGLQQSISQLTAWNSTALDLAANTRILSAENVRTVNGGIGTSELIEENERTVNDIYLATIAKDVGAFTPAQTTVLLEIALQCPMAGGNAVHRARAMYSLIDEEQDYDDAGTCLPYGIVFREMEQTSSAEIKVIPNPASDEVTLVCSFSPDDRGSFVLFDAVGQEVFTDLLRSDTERHVMALGSLAAGPYHYVVYSARGQLGEGKLTIVH